VEVAANDVAELPVAQAHVDELDEESFCAECALEIGAWLELADERAESNEALAEELDAVHDVDAHAGTLEVLDDRFRHATALVDERVAIVGARLHVALAMHGFDQSVDGARQAKERRLRERRFGASRAERIGKAERRDAGREK
jgi:hypothetical protein